MTGVIYCYTSPSGKKYVGQTKNEINRKTKFKYANTYSSGGKIDLARKKYGVDSFTYAVLETINADSLELLKQKLDEREIYWIDKFDSFNNGYNSTRGGDNNNPELISKALIGHKVTEETKQKLRERCINRKAYDTLLKYKDKALKRLQEKCNKTVLQFSIDGTLIKEWPSVTIAAKELGFCRTAISDCWNKGKSSAYGYIWKLKNSEHNTKKKIPSKYKPVCQYDINGNYIKSFASIKDAAASIGKGTNANISSCCRGKAKSAYGFIWKFK